MLISLIWCSRPQSLHLSALWQVWMASCDRIQWTSSRPGAPPLLKWVGPASRLQFPHRPHPTNVILRSSPPPPRFYSLSFIFVPFSAKAGNHPSLRWQQTTLSLAIQPDATIATAITEAQTLCLLADLPMRILHFSSTWDVFFPLLLLSPAGDEQAQAHPPKETIWGRKRPRHI